MLEQLPAAEASPNTRQHARVGGRIDHPIHSRQHFEIARRADVALDEPSAELSQAHAVGLRARALKVIDADDRNTVELLQQPFRNTAADKSADAR